MDKSKTINVKGADGKEVDYITSSQGLTLEAEDLRVKTTLDSTGTFESFLIGHARIENHSIAHIDQPQNKARRVEIQIRAKSFDEEAPKTETKSCAGELQVIYTEQDHELSVSDGWTFILYIPKEAASSIIGLVESKKLRKLFAHVTTSVFLVDARRSLSPFNMPRDFLAQSSISYGEVSWISTDSDSIDLREYSDSWTEEEKASARLVNETLNMKRFLELTRYIKWIAGALVALTVVTLLKV